MKAQQVLPFVLFLLIASLTFACADLAPEERIINTVDEVFDRIDRADSCAELAIDLAIYCETVVPDIADDMADIIKESSPKEFIEKLAKINATIIERSAETKLYCDPDLGEKKKYEAALDICLRGIKQRID